MKSNVAVEPVLYQARVSSWQARGETLFTAKVFYSNREYYRMEDQPTELRARQELVDWAERVGKTFQWENGEVFRPPSLDRPEKVSAGVQHSFLDEIRNLHSEIISSARTTLDKAIRIGELLTEQKDRLKHGQWLPWVKENLPFDRRTATNYMIVYAKRETVSHLKNPSEAYRLLAAPEPEAELELVEERNGEASIPMTPIANGPQTVDAGLPSREEDELCSDTADKNGRKLQVQICTGDNENYTPPEFLDLVRTVLGSIDLDPASNAFAQKTVKATRFFDEKQNGLAQKWSGRVFLNPPYSNPLIGQFIGKLVDEFKAGRVTEAILLTNDNTDTEWFHLAAFNCSLFCLRNGRISFYKSNGVTRTSPPSGQTVFYFGKDQAGFRRIFGASGLICRVEPAPISRLSFSTEEPFGSVLARAHENSPAASSSQKKPVEFVIRRRLMDGKRFRFYTGQGGWTNDPTRALRYPSQQVASLRCKDGDNVVLFHKAVKKFEEGK